MRSRESITISADTPSDLSFMSVVWQPARPLQRHLERRSFPGDRAAKGRQGPLEEAEEKKQAYEETPGGEGGYGYIYVWWWCGNIGLNWKFCM